MHLCFFNGHLLASYLNTHSNVKYDVHLVKSLSHTHEQTHMTLTC